MTSLETSATVTKAIEYAAAWCHEMKIPEDHGIDHATTVMRNAARALPEFVLSESEKLYILLAALLHDLDDRKFVASANFDGARKVLKALGIETLGEEIIITMISLVSCSKNGNTINYSIPLWMYIPRDADRLEALGYIGIKRAHDTTVEFARRGKSQTQFWTEATPRCTTREELSKVASPQRMEEYKKGGYSASLIDHFYDKLLHIHHLSSGSTILRKEAEERREILVEFVLEFGRTGTIDWAKWLK